MCRQRFDYDSRRHGIEVWRFENGIIVAAQIAIALINGGDEANVGVFAGHWTITETPSSQFSRSASIVV